jgi:hypothetical protein
MLDVVCGFDIADAKIFCGIAPTYHRCTFSVAVVSVVREARGWSECCLGKGEVHNFKWGVQPYGTLLITFFRGD